MFSSSLFGGQSQADEAHDDTHIPGDFHSRSHSHGPVEGGCSHSHSHGHSYEQRSITGEISDKVSIAMRKAYSFDEDTTIVMDFACGTGRQRLCCMMMIHTTSISRAGLISRGLAPYCKSIVGVDIDPVMVAHFAEKIHNQGIPPEEMRVVCADLQGVESELDGQKFDVIVCSAAYHHFTSINRITRTLRFFLKPGGCLLVVDFMQSAEPVPEDVPNTRGFTEEDIRGAFEGAGLENVSVDQFNKAKFHGQVVRLFLAKGINPTSGSCNK
ncbi:S-adenosyl-L-methionine-dependent methyltransferase [Mycena galopus ATCC 62051]|nr:S-adenosyl-L-methionine-dependent methyltransferase [Mycena galopus ATCC 62051]